MMFQPIDMSDGRPKGRPSGDGLDPENQASYDVNCFYTRRSDKRGLDKELRVGIPPGWHYLAHAMKEEFPAYRTVADLLRDGLVHRLHYLSQNLDSPILRKQVEVNVAAATLAAMKQENEDLKNFIREGSEGLQQAIDMEDWGAVETIVALLRRTGPTMPPTLSVQAQGLADTYEQKLPK